MHIELDPPKKAYTNFVRFVLYQVFITCRLFLILGGIKGEVSYIL